MIAYLREMDASYFGTRNGRKPSAISIVLAVATGFTPWAFVQRFRTFKRYGFWPL